MSHIFDALQRSEAERSGNGMSPLSAVTELLERAERGTASRWDAAPGLDPRGPILRQHSHPLLRISRRCRSLVLKPPMGTRKYLLSSRLWSCP
jgi:hypothetical protein